MEQQTVIGEAFTRVLRYALVLLALLAPWHQALAAGWPAVNSDIPTGRTAIGASGQVATNAALNTASTLDHPTGVWRITYGNGNGAPPLFYQPSGAACALNSGNGDNGSQVKSADGKCWLAVFSEAPLIEQFGADATATTDSSAVILACANYVSANGAGYCRKLTRSHILITTSFTFPAGSGLECSQGSLGNPGIDWADSPYRKIGSVRLASTATISYNSMFLWRNCFTYRNGMTFPAVDASAYAGTAFQSVSNGGAGTNDVVFENDLTIGFDLILNSIGDRLRVNGFYGDGNNCIVLNHSFDTSSLEHVRCYPYGTVATNGCGPSTTNCQRSGTGIAVFTASDDTTFGGDVLVLGYLTNFYFNGTNIHIGKIWSDYAGVPNPNAIGVHFGPAAAQTTVGSIMNYASTTGVKFSDTTGDIQIGSMVSQGNAGDCMLVNGGFVKIASFVSHSCGGWHINNNNTAGELSIQSLRFHNFEGSIRACPIRLAPRITTDHAYFGRITGDGSFSCLIAGSPLQQPAIAITGTFLKLSQGAKSSSHYVVTNATGTVNSMTEGYGSAPVTLVFQNSGLTITQGTGCAVGQFLNLSGANITTVAGRPYTYFFDGSGTGCWRQQG